MPAQKQFLFFCSVLLFLILLVEFVLAAIIGFVDLITPVFATAMPETTHAAMSHWAWFNSLPANEQRNTIFLLASPGAGAVITNLFFTASLRRLYNWGDKMCFWMALLMAAFWGPLFVFFLSGPVNQTLGYDFYNNQGVIGAIFLTPAVSHFAFRVLSSLLYATYITSVDIPKTSAWYWVGAPAHIISRSFYFQLTGKKIAEKVAQKLAPPSPPSPGAPE